MNATAPTETDELDRLFSDFFKSQLKQPWPKAPVPAAGAPTSEPSELVTTRTADAPRNAPAKTRDNTARARFTLAASVALVLGTGWFLADGFEPVGRAPVGNASTTNSPGMLSGSEAKGTKGGVLDQMQKNKIKEAPKDDGAPKIDLGKEE